MYKNYFKTAWRSLSKNRTFSILNIAGLAVGVACSALIFLWIEYYASFNHSIPNLNKIYNIKNIQSYDENIVTLSVTPFKAKDALLQQFPGVENAARVDDITSTISLGDKYLSQQGSYVDASFLKMFGLIMVKGNASTALNDISQIAISEKLAKTYFGNKDAINKTLTVDNHPFKIAAVYKDIPENMQFNGIDFLLPFQIFYEQNKNGDSWGTNYTDTWVQLNSKANVNAINAKLKKIVKQNNPQSNNELFLYPLKRMILHNRFVNGKEDTSIGQIKYVRMFSIVAFIILLIACINFMNLSTAKSEKRAKEIGLRKALGSVRTDLIARLLSESLVVSYTAVVIAVVLVSIMLPAFNTLIGIHLQLNLFNPQHISFLILIGAVCGLIAGSYPALYLSSFNPICALKNQITKNAGNVSFVRKGLVVVQFVISTIIIIAVILIYQQIQHTRSRDLGFNKDDVMYVNITPSLLKGFPSLKQNLLNIGDVSAVSLGSHSPLSMWANGGGLNWEGKNANEDVLITFVNTDNDYLKTFDITLKEGRDFSENPQADSSNIIINESLAKIMGKQGNIGKRIWSSDNRNQASTIIGITKDFVYNNMMEDHPAPLLFVNHPKNANSIFIRLKPTTNIGNVIPKIQSLFKNADETVPFDYHFIDKDFEQKFKVIQFTGSLATIFGALAIFISCLGLFGLSAFMAEQRTKEIGVRKMLGASVTSITTLLSKEFLKLVSIAFIIALPIGYWLMHNWLQGYAYRINISWYVFVIVAILILFIAFITVSSQAIHAARANPVNSLKAE
ncbi:MAG: ABC transporter permease [Williamsia sp.]|nr:ABC transporter permease [Williamsia sp.]